MNMWANEKNETGNAKRYSGAARPRRLSRLARIAALAALTLFAAAPAAAAVLVSNISQSLNTGVLLSNLDVAQEFTTGSNSDGYNLESVEINFVASPGNGVSVPFAAPSGRAAPSRPQSFLVA